MSDQYTPEQWDRIQELSREGLRIGYCTDPINRPEMETLFIELGKEIGLTIEEVVWCDSPLAAVEMLKAEGYDANEILEVRRGFGWSYSWVHTARFADEYGLVQLSSADKHLLKLATKLTEASAFWIFERAVVATERPCALHVNDQGRLHCTDGPALAWPDGYALWYVDGVQVKKEYVLDPLNTLTLVTIQAERNAETRRALMILYGPKRYLRETGAKLLDSTRHERLFVLDDGRRVLLANDHSTNRVYMLDAPENAKSVAETETAIYGIPMKDLLPRS